MFALGQIVSHKRYKDKTFTIVARKGTSPYVYLHPLPDNTVAAYHDPLSVWCDNDTYDDHLEDFAGTKDYWRAHISDLVSTGTQDVAQSSDQKKDPKESSPDLDDPTQSELLSNDSNKNKATKIINEAKDCCDNLLNMFISSMFAEIEKQKEEADKIGDKKRVLDLHNHTVVVFNLCSRMAEAVKGTNIERSILRGLALYGNE
jgi:hypothetical protein